MSSGVAKPAYWRIVQSRSRYIPLVDAAGERRCAGLAEALLEAGGDVVLVVEALDLDPRVGEDALVVGADDRGDVAVQVVLDRGLLL